MFGFQTTNYPIWPVHQKLIGTDTFIMLTIRISQLALTAGTIITAAVMPVFAATQIYNERGQFQLKPPSEVKQVTVTIIGGGGGGGGGGSALNYGRRGAGGGGGGGGGSRTCTMDISSNETMTIDVGEGGKGGKAGEGGQAGGDGKNGSPSGVVITSVSMEVPLGGGGFYPEPYDESARMISMWVGGGGGGVLEARVGSSATLLVLVVPVEAFLARR